MGLSQIPQEYRAWLALCQSFGVKSYVELGTFTGEAARLAAAMLPDALVVTIDIGNAPHEETIGESLVHFWKGNSQSDETLRRALQFFHPYPIDAVFIDADHATTSARRDDELWWPAVAKLMAFHDIRFEPVWAHWSNARLERTSLELHASDTASWDLLDGVASGLGIGVVFKERP